MAIPAERIDAIVALAGARFAAGDGLDRVVRAVKEAFPGLYATGTQASVMADEPFREEARFDLFLLDGTGHCWLVTAKPESATGIIIAERDDE